ncbi:MAG: porin [Chitinophagaceae bacterium]
MKKALFTGIPLALALTSNAQDTTAVTGSPVTFSAYVEGYYSYDFNKPPDHNRPAFLFNYNRSNEFNVNLAFVRASYNKERVRATFAIAAGTYMNANYSAEPGVIKNIYEADAGYKLSNKRNLWLDIGILPSHIGWESAVGKDNWTLTRSIVAENSPYYEGGARLTYTTDNGKIAVSALALNGWQRITRVNGNSLMSWGTQLLVKPSDKVTLNYSTFLGTDSPDSTRRWRFYHDIYGIIQFSEKIGLTAGFDIGTEQVRKRSSDHNVWYSPVVIVRYTPVPKWAIAARGEYFNDKDQVIVVTGTQHGFRTSGVSLNLDYLPTSNIALRVEGRTFHSKDDIFLKDERPRRNDTAVTFSVAVAF